MLKRLFWAALLALLLSTEAYAERGLQTLTNCDNYPDPETNASLCHQTTSAGGRTAGHVYSYDGKEWIDLASIAAPGAGDIEGVTAGTNLTGGGTSGTVTLGVANPLVGNVTGNLTGNVTGDVLGNVNGNASTATSLANNPTDCPGGEFANAIDAGGNLTCATPPGGGGGSGDIEGVTAGTNLTGGGSSGTVTLNVANPVVANLTGNVTGSVTGNASTATALAANGANCSAGSAPRGVNASGAVEDCFAVAVQADVDGKQPLDSDLTALAGNTTDGLWSRTGTGTGAARTITGTANQITVTNGSGVAGNPTLSIPTSPTLPGTTTGTFNGNLTGNVTGTVTGNASTATALAANGANCATGQVPLGVSASGAAEDCVDLALITEVTVATLPVGAAAGVTRTVTDGESGTDCLTGGGSERALCSYDGVQWVSLGGGGGSTTVPTFDEIFDADSEPTITGATEAKPFIVSGNDPDYGVVIRVTSANSPEVIGKCAGVVGDCDRVFSHNAGKKTDFIDSDGNPEVSYTEDVGFTKLTTDAEAQGNILYRGAAAWQALAPGTSGQVLTSQGAAANPQWTTPAATTVKSVQAVVFDFATATSTGDGKFYFRVPSSLNNYVLTGVQANVIAAGTTGTINIDLARCAATTAGAICTGTGTSIADMLSTNLTIDSGENSSSTAAAAAVINTANDDVTTGMVIRIDVDAIHTTPATGLIVNMDFTAP